MLRTLEVGMISEERRFRKKVELYSLVVDAGLSWGFSDCDFEEVIRHKTLTSLRARNRSEPQDKYLKRQNVEIQAQNKDFGYVQPNKSIPIFNDAIVDLDDTYKYVRTGTPIKNPDEGVFYW